MRFRKSSLSLAAVAGGLLLAAVVGCGQYGGGAAVVPEVTVLPAEFGAATATEPGAPGAASAASPAAAGGVGSVKGRVVLTGAVPSLALLVTAGSQIKDAEVCAAVNVADERLVASPNGGLANAFVYLQKAPKGGKALETSDQAVIFDQKNCQFLPHCLLVPTGRTLKILSDDGVAHNTHTYPNKNDGMSQTIPINDRDGQVSLVYRRPEAVPLSVKCDFHAWMSAWHLPLDHPYAAVTDADGGFVIADLPVGKHGFTVWHESVDGNFIERKLNVDIKAGETAEVTVELPVARLKL